MKSKAIIIVMAVITYINAYSQHAVVQTLRLTDGMYNGLLQATGLTSNVTYTLPPSGGTLLTAGSVWTLGGQSLLPGPSGVLGSSDNVAVQLVTNGVPRLHINGAAGADIGWIGVGTTTPEAPLHVASTINPTTVGFHAGLRVATVLDASSTPPTNSVIGGTVSILELPAGTNDLSNADIIFGAGGAVFSSNTATPPPGSLVGVIGNVTLTPPSPGMTPIVGVVGVYGTNSIESDANVTSSIGVLANNNVENNVTISRMAGVMVQQATVGTSTTITDNSGLLVQAPSLGAGSTILSHAGIQIENVHALSGVTTSNAVYYDGPGIDDFVVTSDSRVGVGTNAPDVSVDINGGLVVRPPTVIDIEAAGSATVTVGNRSFLVISNPNIGAGDVYPNNAPITLTNGIREGQLLIIRSGGT
jgi:hypothetical protein